MKYKPGQIDWSKPEDEQTDPIEQAESQQPKTRHNKCQPWHELHRKAIDKTDPKLYPNLYETKGKKGKISLAPFESLLSDAEQALNLNKDYFKNISHVYNLAFYRGMMDIQYQFVVKKGHKPSTIMSDFLRENERESEVENEILRALEYISREIDKVKKKLISTENYLKKEKSLIKKFEDNGLGERLRAAIDQLFADGEETKSSHRISAARSRAKAKEANIKVLD